MPGGSMGICTMSLVIQLRDERPASLPLFSWCIIPLTILVKSCITPFHHSSGYLNHFLILSHWVLWYCAIHTVTGCLLCNPCVDLHCASCYRSWDRALSLMPCWWVYGHTSCDARRRASSALAFMSSVQDLYFIGDFLCHLTVHVDLVKWCHSGRDLECSSFMCGVDLKECCI
jgi:hypothetical protein